MMGHVRRNLYTLLALLAATFTASAHVKWFATWSFNDAPRTIGEIITPPFIGLTALTIVALMASVFIDRRLGDTPWYKRIIAWFDARQPYALLVLRIGLGMTLMLAWAGDTLLTPDLPLSNPVIGWVQFILALLLIFPQTVPVAGAGTLLLYLLGIVEFGAFYMLDYFIFVGVGIYLIVAKLPNARLQSLRLPALYFSVGFSLVWVAIEKIIYPQWGMDVLAANPALTLGLDPSFFLLAAAFVELALGYLLIIGLLERPMAVVITLVFFTTTVIFGKTEVIGHTIIHAALIAFLLEGTRRTVYPAPIDIHRTLGWRVAFAAVNFVLMVALLLIPYQLMSQAIYTDSLAFIHPVLGVIGG
jgi:uncharacterized membrane protein YphA (DoxX/SURF4 family)